MFFIGIALVIFALSTNVTGEAETNCNKLGILVYEDLGCKPVKDKPEDNCPSSYDCRHFHDFGTHCYFNGEKYILKDVIPDNITTVNCNAGCYCTEDGSFTCVDLDCPEYLNPSTDCLYTYDLNKCCSVGKLCEPSKEVATCEVDGQIYKEGERFYPKDTCSLCVCQKGFSGRYESPYCRTLSCHTELKHRKDLEGHCAPVYDRKAEELCCPFFWACSSEDDVINSAETQSKSNDTCIFGNKNVKIGEYLEKTVEKNGRNHNVRCECTIPPLLTCIVKDRT